jgi:hypothetical protein
MLSPVDFHPGHLPRNHHSLTLSAFRLSICVRLRVASFDPATPKTTGWHIEK